MVLEPRRQYQALGSEPVGKVSVHLQGFASEELASAGNYC
jgi:hypothetical protein